MPTQKSYIDGEFGQIHVRQAGSASAHRPLFCLHQSPKNGLEFEEFMLAAGSDRLVISADYPGSGMSDRPPADPAATIQDYARNMWTVADDLSLETIDLLGNHTGAKVAIEMAHQQPDRVGTIGMISAALLTPEERAQFKDFFEPIPLDREGTRQRENWDRIVRSADPNWPLEMMDRSFLQTCMGGEAYEWGHAAAFAYDQPFTDGLRDLPHRKVLFNPADVLQEHTRRAEGIMTNGRLVERPDWTFGFLDIDPEGVAAFIRKHLDA